MLPFMRRPLGPRSARSHRNTVSSQRVPFIEECHSVAGELSLILKVRVADTATLLGLSERLRQIPGIVQTETTIVLKTQIARPMALKK
jgi:DNA-binding Lrp family transcriptional regulator